jgi:hypothetical protein
MFHGPALPGVLKSVVRCTHPPWLRRGSSGLALSTIQGSQIGQVQG